MPAKEKTKAKSNAKTKKLPKFFSFANRQFVILLAVIVAAMGVGSWKLYGASAATDGKTEFPNITNCAVFQPYLVYGVKNQKPCVRSLQHFLNVTGHNAGAVDGIFGNQTTSAVVSFQRAKGVTAYGGVNHETWGVIVSHCGSYNYGNPALYQACYQ